MNKKIVEAFDAVTMPVQCEEKIRTMAAEKKPVKHFAGRITTAAASMAMVLVFLLALSPEARAAVEGWVVKYIFRDSDLTVYEGTDVNGDMFRAISVDTEAPGFAKYQDGRLYFVGNGENLDITDEISPDVPFFYTYVDDYNLTHYMAVGYSGTLDNFGIYEFLREENEGQQPWEGWAGGTGRNFLNPETETRYPWVDIVWEELNVPWPKPGT